MRNGWGCEAGGKQCKIIVSEDESNRNTFLDDTDLRFEAEMAAAVFCPVPRGDSAATKIPGPKGAAAGRKGSVAAPLKDVPLNSPKHVKA